MMNDRELDGGYMGWVVSHTRHQKKKEKGHQGRWRVEKTNTPRRKSAHEHGRDTLEICGMHAFMIQVFFCFFQSLRDRLGSIVLSFFLGATTGTDCDDSGGRI